MDRIGRLFGKKNASEEIDGKINAPEDQVQSDPNLQGPESFGLKFILETGEERLFTSLPVTLGRAKENAIVLDHESVSSTHAIVYFDEQAQDVCLLDQDSLNGVFIDNLPTHKNVLYDGVKITLGKVNVTFRDTGYIHTK